MLWTDDWLQVQMGIRTENSHFSWNHGDAANKLAFDAKNSNTTKKGEWVFTLSERLASPAALRFYLWQNQPPLAADVAGYTGVNDCPCSLSQLYIDSRYKSENKDLGNLLRCKYGVKKEEYDPNTCIIPANSPDFCAYRKQIVVTSSNPLVAVVTRCCYTAGDGNLIIARSKEDAPLTQWLVTTNVNASQLVSNNATIALDSTEVVFSAALEGDTEPFNDGCIKTQSCDLYYERRPIPNCENYKAPKQGWFHLSSD